MSGEDKSEGAGKSGEAGMKTGYIGILAVGLMIGIIIGIVVGAFGFPQTQSYSAESALRPEEAGEKVTDFISNYGGLPPGADVAVINVTEDFVHFEKPVLSINEFEVVLGERSWEDIF